MIKYTLEAVLSIRSKSTGNAASKDEGDIVTALARGLDILRCFDKPDLHLTVSEISRRVGLSQPTAWRLCRTLMDRGFLIRSPGSTALRVGIPVLTLGFAAIKGLNVPTLVAPYIQELTDVFGCSTTLSIRQNIEIMSIDSRHGDFLEPNHPVGFRAALGSTASGLAVLSMLPPEERLDTMKKLEARDRAAWPRRRDRIEAAHAQYLLEGRVIFDGMYDAYYTSIAIALVEGHGQNAAYWAISCGGLTSRWSEDLLEKAAAALVRTKDILQPALAMIG